MLPSFCRFLLSKQIPVSVALQAESHSYHFLCAYSHFYFISDFKPLEIVSVTITYNFFQVPWESLCLSQLKGSLETDLFLCQRDAFLPLFPMSFRFVSNSCVWFYIFYAFLENWSVALSLCAKPSRAIHPLRNNWVSILFFKNYYGPLYHSSRYILKGKPSVLKEIEVLCSYDIRYSNSSKCQQIKNS